jgi:hypothetical protein
MSRLGWLIVALLLIVTAAGSATAGALVTGAQIKNGTVTSKDIKDRSLKLKDVKPAEVAKLRGADGKDGASAFAPLPSGTTVIGGGMVSFQASTGSTHRTYTALPFLAPAPLTVTGSGRNLWFGSTGTSVVDSTAVNATACTGFASAPAAAPGTLCVYVFSPSGTATESVRLIDGVGSGADAADRSGFYVVATAVSESTATVPYTWAYTAP